jgi:hypothetical protein
MIDGVETLTLNIAQGNNVIQKSSIDISSWTNYQVQKIWYLTTWYKSLESVIGLTQVLDTDLNQIKLFGYYAN